MQGTRSRASRSRVASMLCSYSHRQGGRRECLATDEVEAGCGARSTGATTLLASLSGSLRFGDTDPGGAETGGFGLRAREPGAISEERRMNPKQAG